MITSEGVMGIVMALVSKGTVYPYEVIDDDVIMESMHLWMAKNNRKFTAMEADSQLTMTEIIDKMLSVDLDTLIDNLLSIAAALIQNIEYAYSTASLVRHLEHDDIVSGIRVMNTESGNIVNADSAEIDLIKLTGSDAVRHRIPDVPMQMDHLNQITGAIRALMVIKEAFPLDRIPSYQEEFEGRQESSRLFDLLDQLMKGGDTDSKDA